MFDTEFRIGLRREDDFEGFRAAVRPLLAQDIDPARLSIRIADAEPSATKSRGPAATAAATHGPQVPRALFKVLAQAALHAHPERYALIYRLLWRMQREPALARDPVDADVRRLGEMAQAVRRDLHKMKAFVRFREVAGADGAPCYVAWFDPSHHIVRAVSGFFVRRFAGMQFAILTPRGSVRWDGHTLALGGRASRADAPPADAGEALWLTYYANIFNPARLKLAAMRKEMPTKYWPNLPESVLIAPLAARAAARSRAMVSAAPTLPQRRIPIHARAPDAARRALADPDPQCLASPAIAPDGPEAAALSPPPGLRPLTVGEREAALGHLRERSTHCQACPLAAHATQTVHGEGTVGARWMVVAEQPGDLEDLQGRVLVGPAGQLFERALAHFGIARERLYVTNAVKHFKHVPRGKRRLHQRPTEGEAARCQPWLDEEIRLVQPELILALGLTATRAVLGRTEAMKAMQGRPLTEPRRHTPVVVTLHPAALLRLPPTERANAWTRWLADWRVALELLPP